MKKEKKPIMNPSLKVGLLFSKTVFKINQTLDDNYNDLFFGKKAQEISQIWANEGLTGCSECAFQQYCGADPVHNHAHKAICMATDPQVIFVKRTWKLSATILN